MNFNSLLSGMDSDCPGFATGTEREIWTMRAERIKIMAVPLGFTETNAAVATQTWLCGSTERIPWLVFDSCYKGMNSHQNLFEHIVGCH